MSRTTPRHTPKRGLNIVLATLIAVTGATMATGAAPAASAATIGPTTTPNADNTGVPAGTKLKVHYGDLVIKTPGAVIDGLDIRGFVRVDAANVTIKNSIIRGTDRKEMAILIHAGTDASNGLVVRNVDLKPSTPTPHINGVYGYGFTLDRVDISNVIDSVHIFGDNVTIANSYLHDNLHYANDPGWNGHSHDDSIQLQKGKNIQIVNNSISGSYNAALMVTQDQGIVSDVRLSNNVVSGGGCTVNVAEKKKGAVKGLKIANNIFGDSRFGCSMLIPPTTDVYQKNNVKADGSTLRVDRRQQ
ncbi:hypothetical protein FVA74_02050 [Salinibacterium sp. dk2585]|uniref:right-handed parallel beta-helix repeat-containing protein n=1 Tax=unclassified Salinibacterium TaxID=2632331 RepID=UPI0011C257B6|nr:MULTISPECIES: right-handed parallel beta-helix repeat-containing protein [unclassified Salinibacterium]QEE60488.1 hypothetical protein FVA74_02050 [Salinibacterium sp. dk2585]TXK55560.1 hypothetical protein FVP63_02195 [Salinibacterium sp. dk5596]